MKLLKTIGNRSGVTNPYRFGLGIIIRRFLWDINPLSWKSRKKMIGYREKFKGQKAVIVCNGPSLNLVDLTCLDSVFTFGLNKINLLFSRSGFRPNCIVAVNPYVISQNALFYNDTDIPLILDSGASRQIVWRDNVTFIHSAHVPRFAKDCSFSIYQGATVTFVAMQLAFHMGFEKVGLIGCDHNFITKGTPHKLVNSLEKDVDHFDPNYFSGGLQWQLPDLALSEASYNLAKESYDTAGRWLVNCTVGGNLEVFPRMDLKKFLEF